MYTDCTFDGGRHINIHSLAIPLRPLVSGSGVRGVGLLLVEPAYENTGPEYSTERKCSRPLLNADKDIETTLGNGQGFGVNTSVNYILWPWSFNPHLSFLRTHLVSL